MIAHNRITAIAVILSMTSVFANAQDFVYQDPEFGIAGRISVAFDQKIASGLHVALEEELRSMDGFTELDRSLTSLHISYKTCPYFKVDAGYTFMKVFGNPDDLRHRANLDFIGVYKFRQWKLSLRERFQTTTKTKEINTYQQPRTALALRSRLKASYNCRTMPLKPYASFEIRNTLNSVDFACLPVVSYNDVYINRYRGSIGTEWVLDSRNLLDFYILLDYNYNIDIDATKKGKLKAVSSIPYYCTSFGVAYIFSRK